jgi:hypothetical protein
MLHCPSFGSGVSLNNKIQGVIIMIKIGLIGAGTMGALYAQAFTQYQDSERGPGPEISPEIWG